MGDRPASLKVAANYPTEADMARKDQTMTTQLVKIDLKGVEEWREYDFGGRVYRINNPISVEFRRGGETHRVVDAEGVAHCVPAPGHLGCALRWKGPVVA